jgi:tRNA (guanine-N7-)-methyltransferase
MSGRNKLKKFAAVLSLPNVYENFDAAKPQLTKSEGEIIDLKGSWAEKHFKNTNSITLELACGRGEYSLALAGAYNERNFIGVDIKGARIWKGASKAYDEHIENVAFLRTRIEQLGYFFCENEIDEIWITFPDPFLRKSKANRRLTSEAFLNRYVQYLKPEGIIHLKTDNQLLYDFTLETISSHPDYKLLYQNEDIYAGQLYIPELAYKTYYERQHLDNGLTIKYIQARYLGPV